MHVFLKVIPRGIIWEQTILGSLQDDVMRRRRHSLAFFAITLSDITRNESAWQAVKRQITKARKTRQEITTFFFSLPFQETDILVFLKKEISSKCMHRRCYSFILKWEKKNMSLKKCSFFFLPELESMKREMLLRILSRNSCSGFFFRILFQDSSSESESSFYHEQCCALDVHSKKPKICHSSSFMFNSISRFTRKDSSRGKTLHEESLHEEALNAQKDPLVRVSYVTSSFLTILYQN